MKITYVPTPSETEGLAAKHLPSQFIGLKQFNPALLHKYRATVGTTMNNPLRNYNVGLLCQHNEALVPLVASLKRFIADENISPAVTLKHAISQRFIDEISRHEKDSDLTLTWMLLIHMRYAVAVSELSADEHDLYKHFVHSNILGGLLEDNAWIDHYKSLFSIATADRNDSSSSYYYAPNIDHSVSDLIDQELNKHYPAPVILPFVDIAKFGVTFLIQCYLQNVFPLGLPSQKKHDGKLSAHGVRLSSGLFIIHDLLHTIIDPRKKALELHIKKKTDAFAAKDGYAPAFVKSYTPIAVQRLTAIMQCLSMIQHYFMTHLLPRYGKNEYTQAMNGLFFIMHEYPSYNDSLFENNDLEDIIRSLSNGTKKSLLSKSRWGSPEDPLKTSPIDGKSHLGVNEDETKAKIIQYVFSEVLLKNEITILKPRHFDELTALKLTTKDYEKAKRKKIRSLIHSVELKQSQRFIDVEFTMKDGNHIKNSYATLYHKWTNMDDSLGLLKMAGIVIAKPKLAGLSIDESRALAQTTLRQVRKQLAGTIDQFRDRAIFFANLKQKDGTSLTECYFQWQFKTQTRLDEVIAKAVPKPNGPKMTLT